MPSSRNRNAELSLRHLPANLSESDASFSFQINTPAKGDYLLADDGLDLLRSPEGSPHLATPCLRSGDPLTLSQLTPHHLRSGKSPLQNRQQPINTPGSVKQKTRPVTSPRTTRSRAALKNLFVSPPDEPSTSRIVSSKVKSLPDEEDLGIASGVMEGQPPASSSKEEIIQCDPSVLPRKKHSLKSGRIAKSRTTLQQPQRLDPPYALLSDLQSTQENFQNQFDVDASIVSDISISGAAERLVMYSHNLPISYSHDPFLPSTTTSLSRTRSQRRSQAVQGPSTGMDNDGPLTVSQLSPRKMVTDEEQPSMPIPLSPKQLSKKRPAPIMEGSETLKKSKTESSKAALDPSGLKVWTVKGSRPAIHVRNPPLKRVASSKARTRAQTRALISKDEQAGNDVLGASEPLSTIMHRPDDHLLYSTKSIGFNFHLDARLEARKANCATETETASRSINQQSHVIYPIPDFKVLHAAEDAKLAHRKEKRTVTVPVPIVFKTDQRTRERREFEARLKEKEKVLEREMELRNREIEEAEEQAIRELRKKAIPKANEVPEWYKNAPKKRVKDFDVVAK